MRHFYRGGSALIQRCGDCCANRRRCGSLQQFFCLRWNLKRFHGLGRIELVGIIEDDVFDSVRKCPVPRDGGPLEVLPADEDRHQQLIGEPGLGIDPHLDAAASTGPVHTGQELGDASAETTEQS